MLILVTIFPSNHNIITLFLSGTIFQEIHKYSVCVWVWVWVYVCVKSRKRVQRNLSAGRTCGHRVGRGGCNKWESSIDIYTLPCVK